MCMLHAIWVHNLRVLFLLKHDNMLIENCALFLVVSYLLGKALLSKYGRDKLFLRWVVVKNEEVRDRNQQCTFGKVTTVCLQVSRTILGARRFSLDGFYSCGQIVNLCFHPWNTWQPIVEHIWGFWEEEEMHVIQYVSSV